MNKLLFLFKKYPVVVIFGTKKDYIRKIEKMVFSEGENYKFYINHSCFPVFIINKPIPLRVNAKIKIIFNYDDEEVRKFKRYDSLSYGFQKGADVQASDINIDEKGINFKINYQGSSVPFWLSNVKEKERIFDVLPAICLGILKGINLVELSSILTER